MSSRIKQAAAVFDTLENPRPAATASGSLTELVNDVCERQGLNYSQAEIERAVAAQTPGPVTPHPSVPAAPTDSRPPIGRVMARLAIAALAMGGLMLILGAPFYAAFMTTICSWILGCFLLAPHRQAYSDRLR